MGIIASTGAGCAAWHHHGKSRSYDRAVEDEDNDPTYRSDPQRADVEVRYVR
jgi:hypothetical protein